MYVLGIILSLFTKSPAGDAMPSVKCKDIGMDCNFETSASTEGDLEKKIAEHARSAHGIQSLDKDMWMKIKNVIK
jgi:predicted small metal-binding protein